MMKHPLMMLMVFSLLVLSSVLGLVGGGFGPECPDDDDDGWGPGADAGSAIASS